MSWEYGIVWDSMEIKYALMIKKTNINTKMTKIG